MSCATLIPCIGIMASLLFLVALVTDAARYGFSRPGTPGPLCDLDVSSPVAPLDLAYRFLEIRSLECNSTSWDGLSPIPIVAPRIDYADENTSGVALASSDYTLAAPHAGLPDIRHPLAKNLSTPILLGCAQNGAASIEHLAEKSLRVAFARTAPLRDPPECLWQTPCELHTVHRFSSALPRLPRAPRPIDLVPVVFARNVNDTSPCGLDPSPSTTSHLADYFPSVGALSPRLAYRLPPHPWLDEVAIYWAFTSRVSEYENRAQRRAQYVTELRRRNDLMRHLWHPWSCRTICWRAAIDSLSRAASL